MVFLTEHSYSPALGQARLFLVSESKKSGGRPVRGGILADSMSLGKTVTTIALIVATLDELRQEALKVGDQCLRTTLIIVPPALVSQWLDEMRNLAGSALSVAFFNHKTMVFESSSDNNMADFDVVVTTYNALDKVSSRAHASPLKSRSWGRIVLDEMQEIRSSTTAIARNCEELESTRRWMLSGTPLFEDIEDFRGELCFLRLEPFAGNCEDGFFDFAVKNHFEAESVRGLETVRLLSLVMLRRTKTMSICATGLPLLGLKAMTVVYEPVAQDESERAVYCFLEHLVHESIHGTAHDEIKRRSLLRLLRETCVSPLLLWGGFGLRPQLNIINGLMIERNRASAASVVQKQGDARPMTCDEAIRYLSQVMNNAKVREDFVTDQSFGTGGGISRRDRAVTSPEDQLGELERQLESVTQTLKVNVKQRAKAVRVDCAESR